MTEQTEQETKSIVIMGRRWFQKSYGNTYHTVSVVVNGEPVFDSGECYGYGDHYVQTAGEWLERNGIIGENHRPLSLYCRERGIDYVCNVSDVARERDL